MASSVVARAHSPRGEMALVRRDGDGYDAPSLELRVNGVFVMDTVHTQTERQLARVAVSDCHTPRRILVGGLGLGFTVSALLEDRRVASVVVAELEPAVVAWLRDGLVPMTAGALRDPRVEVVDADVRDVLTAAPPASFDAVVLDVDNGPDQLVHASNAYLYGEAGLRQALTTCTAGGALVMWSASQSPDLLARLQRLGSWARHLPLPVTLQGRETNHHLYVAGPGRG